MRELHNVNNYRQIKVAFLSPTNSRGARIKIYEPARYNDDKTESKVFSFDYHIGSTDKQAFEILSRNGWNVIAKASERDNYIFLCDNWSEDFKNISDLK